MVCSPCAAIVSSSAVCVAASRCPRNGSSRRSSLTSRFGVTHGSVSSATTI
ncbi:hypothetical protein ACQEVM_17570 [Streptomyces sp. CA-243310]|uniref:hypothetical protein n=1 Tax=Streptomyces sp. CA-243310 TaxID=3240056 RepID=UPI003D8F17DA